MKRTIGMMALLIAVAAWPAFAGDGHEHGGDTDDHGHAHEEAGGPTVAVTRWTDRMELFLEYPVLAVNQQGRFLIHLTMLDGFRPAVTGGVSLLFVGPDGHTHEFETDAPVREGIFEIAVDFHDAGPLECILMYYSDDVREEFTIDGFMVYESADAIPEPGNDGGDAISFLKEQQWKVPFATANAEIREVLRSVRAVGEVLPSANAYVEIIAPVDGVVQVASRTAIALPGAPVERGASLATIAPPAQGDGWVASRLAYEQAKRDYERAQRLRGLDAISERELELARNEYETRRARFESVSDRGAASALTLTAPISGRVVDWSVRPGQLVRAGDKLMAIVDPTVVWMKVNVYEAQFRGLGMPVGAYIRNGDGGWTVSKEDLTVLSTGGALDPRTRTVPILLEIDNTDGRLTVNEKTPVELYASDGDSAIAVARDAVYEEEGVSVVFVQTGGESFEMRRVETGPRYGDRVSIRSGIRAGERIVSRGGYYIKLASSSAEIGHGHAH